MDGTDEAPDHRSGLLRHRSRLLGAVAVAAVLGAGTVLTSFAGPRALPPLAPRAPDRGPAPEPDVPFTRVLSSPAVADTASSPSASWADVDADGDEDLYVLNGYASLEQDPAAQPDALFLNDGAGGFARAADHPLVEDITFSGSATWADYDDDGDLDVFVADQRGADNRLYRNHDGDFVRQTEGPPVEDGGRSFSAVWVDVDGDGLLDLHVLNGRDGQGGQVDFLYRNVGGGELERVRDAAFVRDTLPSGGATWADFDADGDQDLFLPVYDGTEPNRLYRNDGGRAFEEVAAEVGLSADPLPSHPRTSVAHWVDVDGDADLDLYVGNTGGAADFVYRNDGAGRFESRPAGRVGLDATYVSDAIWVDLENDADLDLVIAAWGGASEIYLNDGAGTLRPASGGDFGSTITFASSVSASDVDGDGDLDLYLTQWPINETGGAPNHLYRNDAEAGHWLDVDLRGTASNRSAVGALVRVTATIDGRSRTQIRSLTSRTSWRSSGSATLHFGLAGAETVDRIEVAWPSGRTDVVDGPIAVDRNLEIVEGAPESVP